MTGVPPEDFLCVSEPDEDECLSSRLDGDEVAHQQVSGEAGVKCCHSVAVKAWGAVFFLRLRCEDRDRNPGVRLLTAVAATLRTKPVCLWVCILRPRS